MMNRRNFIQQNLIATAGLMYIPSLPNFMTNPQILRAIPSSGEKIPAIGMGSWLTFDVGSSEKERASRREVLKKFVELGGKTIDSSPMYGRSEQVIGELAAELGLTDKIWFATKVWTNGEAAGNRQISDSTRFFKKSPTLLQVHNLVDFKTHLNTLKNLKEKGTIRYIGATHYVDSQHESLARLIKTEQLDFIQINLSIRSRASENYLLPLAKERGVAVIINQPFETGALFDITGNKALPPWAKDWGITTWAAFFLKYIISNPCVTCAIPATRQAAHVKENMAACYGALPDETTRKKMVAYFEKL